MTTEKKSLMGAAGSAGGGAPNVADVFSTYLYTGDETARDIVNGIDLSGEGGMVWSKQRTSVARDHLIYDTERGFNAFLVSNDIDAGATQGSSYGLTSFNSDGFSLGLDWGGQTNNNNDDYVTWTFRKAPKFFDVVTYTGDGVANRQIAHGLDGPVGMIIVKETTHAEPWLVEHRSVPTKVLYLDDTSQALNGDYFSSTDTHITLKSVTGNQSGHGHVMYLFAHDTDADEGMIQCGSYTGTGVAAGPEINLGWEPQYLLIKSVTTSQDWVIFDTMRGIATGGDEEVLFANLSDAALSLGQLDVTPTGFKTTDLSNWINKSGDTYIYMAIRAPMMKEPESGSEVFNISRTLDAPIGKVTTGFDVDTVIKQYGATSNGDVLVFDRLRGASSCPRLGIDSLNNEASNTQLSLDTSVGFIMNATNNSDYETYYAFNRAKLFYDVMIETGTGVQKQIPHNLGVVPEMIWVRGRDGGSNDTTLYHAGMGEGNTMNLNADFGRSIRTDAWGTHTDTYITVIDTYANTNGVSLVYRLFATLEGISKVGSYDGDGTTGRVIPCGFSSGARFLFIQRYDSGSNQGENADSWYWDTETGISTGNNLVHKFSADSYNNSSADSIDPNSAGFIVNQNTTTNINKSGASYIFYAIA